MTKTMEMVLFSVKKSVFFGFPSDPKAANEWKILCRCEDLILKSTHRVCEKHFKSCDIESIKTFLDQKGIIAAQVRHLIISRVKIIMTNYWGTNFNRNIYKSMLL